MGLRQTRARQRVRYGRYEWGIPTALPRTAVNTCIYTHTHTHLLTYPGHRYARLTDALRPASFKMLLSIPEADRLSYSRYRHPSRPSTLMLPRAYPTPRPSTLS